MNAVEVCKQVKGMALLDAEAFIKEAGGLSRIVYQNGKIVLENITKDFNENRISLQVESGNIKLARVG